MPSFEDALSADRFSTYRLWAGQDQSLARRLYTFNVQLSAALYGPLHMLEVSLRNVADRQLTAKRGVDWMDDPNVLVTNYQKGCIEGARATVKTRRSKGSLLDADPGSQSNAD